MLCIDNSPRVAIVPPVMRPTRILAIAGLSTALFGTANAEIESGISVGYHSEYIDRGVNLGEELVDLGLGISGSTALANWNLGASFGSWDDMEEFHVEASLSRHLGGEPFPLVASAGLANTSYEGTLTLPPSLGGGGASGAIRLADRLEPFVGVSTTLGALNLSTKVFFNISDSDPSTGWAHDVYWEVGASYSADLGANLSGSLSGELGVWDTDPFVAEAGEGVYYSVTGALQYALSDNITLSAYATQLWNDNNWNLEDETFAGASVSVSF